MRRFRAIIADNKFTELQYIDLYFWIAIFSVINTYVFTDYGENI